VLQKYFCSMSFRAQRFIHELHNQVLLVEPSRINGYYPLYVSLMQGNIKGYDDEHTLTEEERREIFTNKFCYALKAEGTFNNPYRLNEAPANSVAVIRIESVIMKTDYCGEPGTESLSRFVATAANNPNIAAIVLEIDSPGGTVSGTQTLVDAIRTARQKKPIVSFINEGMAASAAYWIGAAANEVYASQATDMVGSIGVYQTMVDATKSWELAGYKVADIYAPQSTEKNEEYREFVSSGKTTIAQEHLKKVAEIFINSIKESRAGKINLSAGDPFKGRLYEASDAVQIGLIEGIKKFDQVISRAYELASNSSFSNANNNSSNMAGLKLATTLVWISGCFGAAIPETLEEEHIQTINDKGAEQAAQLVSANTRLSEMESQLQAMTERATGAEGKVTELQGVINTYGNKPGAETTAPPKADEKIDPPAPDELSNMAHNKAVDENPFLTN
jgi:signal peptide peptidase SppA